MTIDISESRTHLLKFLENNPVGVLATATQSGKPHAATVYVTFDQELNIYFVTRKETQKSRNLQSNSQAAIAIYNASSLTTLQAEGTVIVVNDLQKMQWVFDDIWRITAQSGVSNSPPPAQLLNAGVYVVYKLAAPSIRLATYSSQHPDNPEDIFDVVPTHGGEHFNSYDKPVN